MGLKAPCAAKGQFPHRGERFSTVWREGLTAGDGVSIALDEGTKDQ
jgi:hypothetical protein